MYNHKYLITIYNEKKHFSVLFDSMLYLSVLICYFFSVYQKVLVLENLIQSIAFEMLGKFWQGLVYYKCVCSVLCISLSFSLFLLAAAFSSYSLFMQKTVICDSTSK